MLRLKPESQSLKSTINLQEIVFVDFCEKQINSFRKVDDDADAKLGRFSNLEWDRTSLASFC